jgi:hypothetical protein
LRLSEDSREDPKFNIKYMCPFVRLSLSVNHFSCRSIHTKDNKCRAKEGEFAALFTWWRKRFRKRFV